MFFEHGMRRLKSGERRVLWHAAKMHIRLSVDYSKDYFVFIAKITFYVRAIGTSPSYREKLCSFSA
jgi:hypothetical protein